VIVKVGAMLVVLFIMLILLVMHWHGVVLQLDAAESVEICQR
jgi:hypothetical protein